VLCALAITLSATNTASARERAQTKTRIRDFELAEHHSHGLSALAKQRNTSGKSRYWCPNSHQIHSFRWRDPSGRDASDVADWISRQDWIDALAPALAGAGVESGIPPLALVGEASLIAMEGINAIASLEAHRQSTAAIAKAASDDDKECKGETRKAPEANGGNGNGVHGGAEHNDAIDREIAELRKDPRVSDIRKNQVQADVNGNRVGSNRPDIQYNRDDIHYNHEIDTNESSSLKHQAELPANDPDAVNIFDLL
jgi:hypothetical protein